MHHLPLSLYYSPEQLKSLYSTGQLKALYGGDHLKSMSVYGHEHLKALYNHEQLKSLCSAEQLKSLQTSPESLKPIPTSPLLSGGSPPSSASSSLFSIDSILSQNRPLLAHRPTPTYPYPYPGLPHLATEMFGKIKLFQLINSNLLNDTILD